MKLPKCKYEDTEMDLATLENTPDVGLEDHGIFTMFATFDYGGGMQGLGYGINQKFIEKFIEVFGVMKLSECKGQVFVEHTHSSIDRLIHLSTKNGKEFDIRKWCEDCKRKELKCQ